MINFDSREQREALERKMKVFQSMGPSTDLDTVMDSELVAYHTLLHSLERPVESGKIEDWTLEEIDAEHERLIEELKERDLPYDNFPPGHCEYGSSRDKMQVNLEHNPNPKQSYGDYLAVEMDGEEWEFRDNYPATRENVLTIIKQENAPARSDICDIITDSKRDTMKVIRELRNEGIIEEHAPVPGDPMYIPNFDKQRKESEESDSDPFVGYSAEDIAQVYLENAKLMALGSEVGTIDTEEYR